MPREYKLRLGDGTVLAVDEQGLRTWAIDGKAMVQGARSQQWRPLPEVLAELAASVPRSGSASASARGPKRDDGIPVIRLKPLDGEPSPPGRAPVRARDGEEAARTPRAAGLLAAASAWMARLTRRPGATPAPSQDELELPGARPDRRDPRQPPPPASELPSLRMAEAAKEWEPEELYEGDDEVGVLGIAWLWVKRLVLIAGLVAAGIVAVNTWPTWLPVVTRFGVALFTKIDEYAGRARGRAPGGGDEKRRQMQDALQQATGQLPHLSRETIQLVMSSSLWSVPDPPEVFSRAYAAAKRGSSALTVREAEELRTLETALLAGLRPAERQRVREYDRARLRRATMPSEDRDVLGLFARGARALPAQSREHLQALFGKAVAAGLTSGGA